MMSVRDDSIVKKINKHYVAKQLGQYFRLNLLLLIVGTVVLLIATDYTQFGISSVTHFFDYKRDISIAGDIQNVMYTVRTVSGDIVYSYQIGPFVCAILVLAVFVLLFEFCNIMKMLLHGKARVYGYLKPLREMAKQAKELSQLSFTGAMIEQNREPKYAEIKRDDPFITEEKAKALEDAIHHFSVEKPNEQIHTNDKSLRSMENAINDLLERMRKAYAMQNRFVSDASHELRTPIAVIQGYVNMLDRWGKEDKEILEESIQAIQNEADHMQKLVEQLLFLARGDAGRNPIQLKEISLNAIMQEVYEESKMIDEKHIYQYYANEEVMIIADEDMMKQSARILIDNASKYTKEQEEIVIRVGRDEDGNPYYSIQDNGKGMKEEEVTHIFERFYRTDDVRNSETGGTGLGLAIAKWIVEQHNGYYNIVSREGLGTRFSVILPQEK